MESTRRRLLNEARSQTGAIVDEMKAYALTPVANDGMNIYGNVRINPITSGPFTNSQEISIPITSTNFDVIEFSNTYLHVLARLRIRCTNAPTVEGDDDFAKMLKENQFVMIGLKCGTHVIRDYQFKFNNVPITTTMQSSAVYEQFLYSTFKGKSEIANKKYVFSPYEEAREYENSVCGLYIPLGDLAEGTFYKDLDIIIPLRELLIMEAFNEFPTKLFGELQLTFHTTPEAFVYTEVDPVVSIRKNIIAGKIDKATPHLSEVLGCIGDTFEYTHAYEQIGISGPVQYISGFDEENNKLKFSTMSEFTPYIDELVVSECWVDCKGYRVTDSALRDLASFFSTNPFVVPAQHVETFTFPSGPEKAGLRTSMTVNFNHTTDVEILMPTDSRQRTVFRNPCMDNFQLQIGQTRYPDQLISTLSPQFHEQVMQSSDFDSIFEASDEFEHSLTDPLTDGERVLKPTTDNTSFVPIYQTERNGSSGNSLWWDGIDGMQKVELNGKPIHPTKDVYYQGPNTPAPILCTCSDSFWLFRILPDGRSNVQYVINSLFEQAYADPSLESVSR